MNRKPLIIFIVFLIWATSLQAVESDWKDELSKIKDKDFIGALSPRDEALAERIAAEFLTKMDGPAMVCGKADITSGRRVDDPDDLKGSSSDVFLSRADAALRPLLEVIGQKKHQSAIVLFALAKMGPKAQSALPLLEWWMDNGQPWSTTAVESISCQQYSEVTLARFSDTQKIDYGLDLKKCLPEYLPRIYELGLSKELIWPDGTIEGTLSGSSTNCEIIDTPPPLSNSTVKQIQNFLDDRDVPTNRKCEALRIMENLWPKSAHAISNTLLNLRKSTDENLQFTAERLIVTLGTKDSADIFNSWIGNNYNTWMWSNYVKYLQSQKIIVLPALTEQLHSQWWNQRAAAASAIAEIGAETSVPELIKAIRPDDWALTEAIIEALATVAGHDPIAKDALTNISQNYWSPMVRKKASEALAPKSKQPVTESQEAELKGIEIGFNIIDHGLQTCKIQETRLWNFPDGSKRKLDWQIANRKQLPRGEFKDVSDWCNTVGDFSVLEQKEGWLVGCMGFELDGGIAWLPKLESKPIKKIARLTVNSIFEFNGEIYLAGYNFFMGANKNAGQLFRIKHDGIEWNLEPVMLLPALTDAVAITDGYMVFDDEHSTVAVDEAHNIFPLRCDK